MKKLNKFLILVFIGLIPVASFSQFQFEHETQEEEEEEEVFYIVEIMPEYPGGNNAMTKFIQKNVQYPDSAREENIQGKVYLNFVVDTVGKIDSIKVVRGVHPLLDAEAIRVIKLMPDWKPGLQRGKPIRVKYNLPLKFYLK